MFLKTVDKNELTTYLDMGATESKFDAQMIEQKIMAEAAIRASNAPKKTIKYTLLPPKIEKDITKTELILNEFETLQYLSAPLIAVKDKLRKDPETYPSFNDDSKISINSCHGYGEPEVKIEDKKPIFVLTQTPGKKNKTIAYRPKGFYSLDTTKEYIKENPEEYDALFVTFDITSEQFAQYGNRLIIERKYPQIKLNITIENTQKEGSIEDKYLIFGNM